MDSRTDLTAPVVSPRRGRGFRFTLISLLGLALASATLGQTVDERLYSGLVWRNIGPFRGGRISAVSGAIGQPGVFYFGLPQGGVWKTTSAGTTWTPIMDSVKEASAVGAVAVAPSDPNVIYVGMGDMPTGGSPNDGNGVYKSIDAGKTWTHMGLEETKQIPSIIVDPHDPNILLVAAQGNLHEKSDQRGVFRSVDGGKTWSKTLYVDDATGVGKIAQAYDEPNVLLATTERHYFAPGTRAQRGRPTPGAKPAPNPGVGLYKSVDGGLTWNKLEAGALSALSGRRSVAIAMHTQAKRMFYIGNAGLYRSDDGGTNWRQMDKADPRVRNGQGGYNCGVYVNSSDPNIVYIINTSSYISKDGGETFTGFKGAPGGDDPQQMWIDPTDGNRLFLGTDQGATVSLDAGQNWSSWYNQPTAQVYHISVDNQYPYWVYATQQDSGCIASASRGNFGEITPLDWLPHPGYEFGSIVADPLNPKITYAGSEFFGFIKTTYPSGQTVEVSPSMDGSAQLRRVLNQPLAFSPTNPHELLAGFQYLLSSTDGGMHWKKLSPDLGVGPVEVKTKAAPAKAVAPKGNESMFGPEGGDEADNSDGPVTDESGQNRPQPAGMIESFSLSPTSKGIIWAGTTNGKVYLTQNHGQTWSEVSIKDAPNPSRADISGIEASGHDPAEAYVAIDEHTAEVSGPLLYRTKDSGKTWSKIVNGLPESSVNGAFTRVIKADPIKKGLLYCATESSVYVSFNDGDNWQPLTLNLPTTSFRDMVVKGNDLVVGTYGRGFWILDDLSPLREITPEIASKPVHLFAPGEAIRVRRNVNGDTPYPPEVPHALNPPLGAVFYYYLGGEHADRVSIDVVDTQGRLVRHLSSDPAPAMMEPAPPVPNFWIGKPESLSLSDGLNRATWDLRYENPPASSHEYPISANPGATPAAPQGPLVPPGQYTIILTAKGQVLKQKLTVKNDPRSPASPSELRRQTDLQRELYDGLQHAWSGSHAVGDLRKVVAESLKSITNQAQKNAVSAFDDKLALLEGHAGGRASFRPSGGSPAPSSFLIVHSSMLTQLKHLDGGDMAPTESMLHAARLDEDSLVRLTAAWQVLLEKDLPALNAMLTKGGSKAIPVPMNSLKLL